MAFRHGKGGYFTLDSDNLTSFLDNVDFGQTVDMAETTTFGAEAKTYVSGQSDSTISLSGKWDNTASTGSDAVLAALVGGETAVTFEYGPDGNTGGNIKYSGSCFVTSYNVTQPVGDVVAWTADLQVSGAITKGTF